MINNKSKFTMTSVFMASVLGSTSVFAGEGAIQHSEGVHIIPYDDTFWGADPTYEDKPYSAEAQLKIYGDKKAIQTPRPMIEWGRDIYAAGPFSEATYAFGALNPTEHQFLVYGDWQTTLAYNDNGVRREGLFTTQLRLDIDYKISSTERIHAFVNPLKKGLRITGCSFTGASNSGLNEGAGSCELERDFDIEALYFEGDLGAIESGLTGEYSGLDLPFAIGFMPLLFQNGVWLEDAFHGAAFTIPAINSPKFDISNMDITFFSGWDKVTTNLANDAGQHVNIYGITTFIESNLGYWEAGYGFTDGNGDLDEQDYHNVTIAFTKRYGGWLTNSVRIIHNFGQDRDAGLRQTADGTLFLVENSLITERPSTYIPYLNLFLGFDRPQSLARDAAAGGILKNTGINFETDNQTGFPKLDDTGNDVWGFALGVEYLFALDQQVVVEFATVRTHGSVDNRNARGDQYALGVRYQKPLDKAWIVRADAILGVLENEEDISGIRAEIRRKF